MREKVRIVKVESSIVSVVPLDIDACAGCSNRECKSNGSLFSAVNRQGFDLEPGCEVFVDSPAWKQLLQGVLAIGTPVLCAVAVWNFLFFCVPAVGEALRAGASLAACIGGAVLVFALFRASPKDLPEVVEVVEVL